MKQVVFGYERWRWDESPEDHFYPVYRLVLENFSKPPCCLESAALLDLALRVIYFSLRDEFFCETLTFSNQGVTLLELITLIRQRSTKRMFRKKRKKKRKGKVWWEKFYVVNSMCPILSYWCCAGGRPRKNALFIPIYKLGVVGDEQWRRVMSELREREQSC